MNDNTFGQNLGQGDEDGLAPLEIQPLPGGLRFMPPIIKEIHEIGGQIHMGPDGTLTLEGFYKNGPMKLDFEEDNTLVAIDKRGRRTRIQKVEDIVRLNFDWWKASLTKRTYVAPERPWLDRFVSEKWVQRRVVYEPKEGDD